MRVATFVSKLAVTTKVMLADLGGGRHVGRMCATVGIWWWVLYCILRIGIYNQLEISTFLSFWKKTNFTPYTIKRNESQSGLSRGRDSRVLLTHGHNLKRRGCGWNRRR